MTWTTKQHLGNYAWQKKKTSSSCWRSCSGCDGGEGFTAANPNFLLSWPEWGGVGPDLTAEVLFFGMIAIAYRE